MRLIEIQIAETQLPSARILIKPLLPVRTSTLMVSVFQIVGIPHELKKLYVSSYSLFGLVLSKLSPYGIKMIKPCLALVIKTLYAFLRYALSISLFIPFQLVPSKF